MRTLLIHLAEGNGGGARRSLLRLALLLLPGLALPAGGCQDPLNVTIPDIVTPDNLNDPRALPAIRAGAIGDFTLSYSGSGAQGSGGTVEGIIMTTGLLGDEWVNSETFPTRIEVDARSIQVNNATMQTVFRNLSRARRSAEFAAAKYRALADTTTVSGFPEVLALAGLTYVFFAEDYCSGVPFSTANEDGTLTFGPPLTTSQVLDTAIARFDAALAAVNALGTGVSTGTKALLTNLATVGKARAQLDKGQFAVAAATVAAVPTSFVYFVEHSEITTRENDGVFNGNTIFKRYSVADKEGINGLAFRSVVDPRTPSRRLPSTNRGFDNSTPQFDNLRFGTRSAPVPVATGLEARLIEAEAALNPLDFATFLSKHNALRAAPPPYIGTDTIGPAIQAVPPGALLPLGAADTVAAGGAVNLHFNERARWLWLSAHRLSDLRRLVRQYARLPDSVFPTGPYFKVQFATYGTDVNFPVPFDEFNNPFLSDLPPTQSCIDRNP